jgi:hypothetical protein
MNRKPALPFVNVLALLIVFSLAFSPVPAAAQIPVTGAGGRSPAADVVPLTLQAFAAQVQNGSATQITGLYVEGVFALPVVAQPSGQAGYVSTAPNTVTYFSAAAGFGSYGFLAHNYLAGANFFNVRAGQIVAVVYGDGHYQTFRVNAIRRFQATNPTSPYSSFIDLAQGSTLTYTDLFYQTYGVNGQLVLQTCIAAEGNDSWGRLFVLATPYVPEPANNN